MLSSWLGRWVWIDLAPVPRALAPLTSCHTLSHTHTHTLTNMPLTQGRCVGDGDAQGEKNPTLPVAWESNEVMFWRPPSQTSMWQPHTQVPVEHG